MKDGLLRKHQERAQRLKEACEAGGRELQRCKDENYDLALRLARQSEERGTALMRNRDLQLEVPGGGAAGRAGGRAAGPRAGLTGGPADRSAQAQPHEGRGRLLGGAQAHAEAPARHGAAAQPGAAVGAAAGEGAAAGPGAGPGGLRAGGASGASTAQPGGGPPAPPPRHPLPWRHRRGGRTRAAPTSRCWRRTGGRRSGTSRSRPAPCSPCARTCARPRPSAPGYAARGGGGGLASQRCVPPGPFLQARPGWPAGPAPSACSPGWVQGPGPGPGLAGLRAAGLAAVSPPQCLEEKEVFELQCLALRKDSKMYKDRIEAILRQMEEVAVERDQVAVRAEPLRGGGGQTGFTQRKQVTLYTRFSPKKERRSPVARQQVKDPALPLPWLRWMLRRGLGPWPGHCPQPRPKIN